MIKTSEHTHLVARAGDPHLGRFRAVRFHRLGPPTEVLQIDELEPVPLNAHEVRIRVSAFALNRADWLFCRGEHYSVAVLPSRLGSECAGTVVEVGSAVDQALLGSRVCTVPFDTAVYGVQGEYATTPAAFLAPWPEGLSAIEAAAIWMQYLTAYFALVEVAALGAGDYVLIPAASSSAGLAAIHVAKLLGATVIATSRSEAKLPALSAAGADYPLSLDAVQDLSGRINEISRGKGVRVVYDPVGGPFVATYLDALAMNAQILIYGVLAGVPTSFDLVPLVRKAAVIRAYSLFNHVTRRDELVRGIDFVLKAVRAGMRPIIDSEFPFDAVLDAYTRLDTHAQIGKIVVRCDP